MTGAESITILLLLAWGTVAGVDLASLPQAMLSRPLVAAAVAGALLGDVGAGLRVGAVLELFALDVLPVGAVRYPDYGAAAVGATAVAAGSPWELGLGVAVGIGLLVSAVGGWSLLALRRLNADAVGRRAAALRSGEPAVIRRLHLAAIGRDAARSLLLAAFALGSAAVTLRWVRLDRETAAALTIAAIGAGAASALGGTARGAGSGRRRHWLAAGGVAGTAIGLLVWGLR